MKVSLQALARHVELAGVTPERLADILPMLGLEVESIQSFGLSPLPLVVVGEIVSFEKHPKADRLSVCQVDVGDGAPRQIVCGAKNFKAGDRVPVALPGTVMPGGFEIKVSKLREVDSMGMMCSAEELGLGKGEDGLLILTPRKPALGTPLNQLYGAPDTVLDISVTPNRGDCLGLRGVARDVAAALGLQLKPLSIKTAAGLASAPSAQEGFKFVRSSSEFCPYYTLRTLRNVKVGPSPEWMRRDLEAAGLRPINNVVDITNWVLLELGQPLHAFDAKQVREGIEARPAREGEEIILLDGKKVKLETGICVIADAERPLVVAGVMGGAESGVTDATTDILLESAWFRPGEIRRVARRLGVSTDSSHRFARDVDPAGVELPTGYVAAKLGTAIAESDIIAAFTRLGFTVKPSAHGLSVVVPSFRSDVTRPIDLVEEFVRIYGTDKVPVGRPVAPLPGEEDTLSSVFTREVSTRLAGAGFTECCHYSLRDAAELNRTLGANKASALALDNPLTADQTHLRASLLPGLAGALALNLSVHADPHGLFEVGTVFRPQADGTIREFIAVAFAALAEPVTRSWKSREAFDGLRAKRLLQDVAALAGVSAVRLSFGPETSGLWQTNHAAALADRGRTAEGACGILDLRWTRLIGIKGSVVAGEVIFPRSAFAETRKIPRYEAFSSFPPVTKDVAVIVPVGIAASEVESRVRQGAAKAAGKEFVLESVNCFDVFNGAGLPESCRSLAFEIRWRHASRTLTDEETNQALGVVIASLEKGAGWTVRR
ncbi:MAG: phenylalanine--tRNA ligase subunit beta [Verrucomicrobia bacterium]|nr:phenylalanine--tRNA ligase subunit beta [Verrucomicrobiota bacterium]